MAQRRRAAVAGSFYPSGRRECERQIAECVAFDASVLRLPEVPAGGVVPHAGWVFSGFTAGKVFAAIRERSMPATFVLFGAVHRYGVDAPALMDEGVWETPLGDLEVCGETASAIKERAGGLVEVNPRAHEGEHSIEVQAPFIKYLFPGARIVPILAPPVEASVEAGKAVGEVVKDNGGRAVALGSTDLTHYGHEYGFAPKGTGEEGLKWVREVNDRRMIELMTTLRADEILAEAARSHNACGAGAVAATAAAMRACGRTSGTPIEYTTSHDVMPERKASMFVGYAGILY
ncbi:MAG: AmmeMemoRadiSam system protein B [bacterium]